MMMRLFLMPGDMVCNACGMQGESPHRQILRSFLNMMFWGAVAVVLAIKFTL